MSTPLQNIVTILNFLVMQKTLSHADQRAMDELREQAEREAHLSPQASHHAGIVEAK
jgi:hypothetical protein